MKNIMIMLGVLFGAFGLAKVVGMDTRQAGCIGIAAIFCFTALGHFAMSASMLEMIPPWVPARKAMIVLSGFLELGLAIAIVLPKTSRLASFAAIVFLVLVTPLNVYSALTRVPFGGHKAGPKYLLMRLPLQVLLISWIWWFGLRLS